MNPSHEPGFIILGRPEGGTVSPGSGDSTDPAPILGISQHYQLSYPQARLKPSFPVGSSWYGHYTHMISSEIDDLGRRLGLW